MRIRPFSDGDTFSSFRGLVDEAVQEIKALDNEYVLKASPTELEEYYLDKVSITPLILENENHYIEAQKGAQVDVSHHFDGVSVRGERIIVKGTTLRIAVPYSGDKALWRIRASTFSLSGYPQLEVEDGVVIFECTFTDDSANPERLKAEIDNNIESLVDAVSNLRRDVDSHNQTAPETIRQALARKRAQAEAAMGAVAALGIPMKRRDEPLTFAAPTRRRRSPASRPVVATEKTAQLSFLARLHVRLARVQPDQRF